MKKILTLFSLALSLGASAQIISTVAGNDTYDYGDGNQAVYAKLYSPYALVIDDSGNVYYSEPDRNIVRKVDRNNIITRVAGSGSAGNSGNGYQATSARLNGPFGLAFYNGELYIADSRNNAIRKVRKDGKIILYSSDFISPVALVFDRWGNLYVGEGGDHFAVRKKDTSGTIATLIEGMEPLMGGGGYGGGTSGSSDPADARISSLAVDDSGNVYFVDTKSNVIRKISPEGGVVLIAGQPSVSGKSDNCAATTALLAEPKSLAIDHNGNLVFMDRGNCRICRIGADGMLTTIAGGAKCGFEGDGASAIDAAMSHAVGIAYDAAGFMYIADNGNDRIRVINPWPAAVSNINKQNGITITPNPSDGRVVVSGIFTQNASLMVLDIAGNLIYQENLEACSNAISKSISLSDKTANGTYVIVARTATETITSRLVIER